MGASSRKYKQEVEEAEAMLWLNWKPLCHVNFVDWVHGEYLRWSFESRINYTSEPEGRIHPWSTCGRFLVASAVSGSGSLAWQELFDSEFDTEFLQRFYNQGNGKKLVISEKLRGCGIICYPVILPPWYSLNSLATMGSSEPFFRRANVIGLRDEHIVVQIVRKTGTSDFLLLHKEDENGFVVKSIFSDSVCQTSFLMEAYISPDNTKIILKPSIHFSVRVKRIPAENNARLLEAGNRHMFVMKDVFRDAMLHVFAFDPRFHWRRLAVGKCRHAKDTSVAIFDIESNTKICGSDHAIHQMSQNLVFSPDGRFLASLVVSPCTERGVLLLENVIVYDSDDLTIIRRINCPGSQPLTTLIPTGIFPVFSRDSRYMAVLLGHDTEDCELDVVLFAVPCDISLQNLCRRRILHLLPLPQLLAQLPLPKRLLDFLKFKSFVH